MILVAVKTLPVGIKPPGAVSMRISTGERYGFVTAAPLFTRASSLEQGKAGGPVKFPPKLVRQIGSVSTYAEDVSPFIPRSAAAALSVRL